MKMKKVYMNPTCKVVVLSMVGCLLVDSFTESANTKYTEDNGGELASRRRGFIFDDED